jgi:sulfur carrier protein ThiS
MQVELRIAEVLHQKVIPTDKNLNADKWDFPEGISIAEVQERINLTNPPTILLINGRQVVKDAILKEGDVLKIFSAVSGG